MSGFEVLLRLALGEQVTQTEALTVLHQDAGNRDGVARMERVARIKAKDQALRDAAAVLGVDSPCAWVLAARLEAAVLGQLPSGMLRPLDIVAAATARIAHAPAVLGSMEIIGLTELSPCWRPLLQALTAHIPVQWTAGPRSTPPWLDGAGVTVTAHV